ncbi:MAG: DUF1549 and DUF1553 domain-containing protein [Verrucomicrobiota bacterium]|nr:DUF1549 and DUF1553 domain-containing protein [Verrucomicrobiota bacterium]
MDSHWAFEALSIPIPPTVQDSNWPKNPLDCFVFEILKKHGLSPSPRASKRVLVRRIHTNLTGLPPTPQEVFDFEGDPRPDAFVHLANRLLADPSYGKRWGRHWLDVARYADAKGYVDAGEPTYPFAYTYRDYVVEAFNQDKPFPQFILEQIAADRLDISKQAPSILAGLGFLTVGSRFNFFPHEIIDDRIDVVTRGFLGLTVSCARCHDHKHDPVSAEDYYALYGIFNNSVEPSPDLSPILRQSEYDTLPFWDDELKVAADKYTGLQREQHARVAREMRSWAADYLHYIVQTTPRHRTQDQPGLVTKRGVIREVSAYAGGAVKHWRKFLKEQSREDPVFGLWSKVFELDRASLVGRYDGLLTEFNDHPLSNVLVVEAFRGETIESMGDVANIYGALLERVDAQWREAIELTPGLERLASSDAEEIRQKLYGPDAPASIRIDETIDYLTLDESVAIRKAYSDIERVFLKYWQEAPARPMLMEDRRVALASHVFHRGDADLPGRELPRVVPGILGTGRTVHIKEGSGRLELAQTIASPDNVLTARVIVNRVWNWHFGSPLVDTPSDFGVRTQLPVQAALLDWLASWFIHSGGSIKSLHRLILGSATWQQSSRDRPECRHTDPDNTLLWRMNPRRLCFEASRDSMLFVSGRLQERPGGPPNRESPQDADNAVRTLYNYIDREDLDDVLRVFDFPSPDISAPKRQSTTVPQQALFLLNSPFVLRQAAALATSLQLASIDVGSHDKVLAPLRQLFHTVYQRNPTGQERAAFASYLRQRYQEVPVDSMEPWVEIAQTLLLSNEFQFMD